MWKLVGASVLVPLAIALGGCATPTSIEQCSVNYTARGAAIGAASGAAIGVGIAAIANATGQGFGLAALGGAVIGGIAGAIAGHQQDKACHQLALKKALDDGYEQARALKAAEAATASAATRPPSTGQTAKAVPADVPAYQTVAWANAKTQHSGSITPLGELAEAPADAVCMTYTDQQIISGKSESITGKACRGPDGEWKPIT